MRVIHTIAGVITGLLLTVLYFIFMKQIVGMPGTAAHLVIAACMAAVLFGYIGYHTREICTYIANRNTT